MCRLGVGVGVAAADRMARLTTNRPLPHDRQSNVPDTVPDTVFRVSEHRFRVIDRVQALPLSFKLVHSCHPSSACKALIVVRTARA